MEWCGRRAPLGAPDELADPIELLVAETAALATGAVVLRDQAFRELVIAAVQLTAALGHLGAVHKRWSGAKSGAVE